MIRSTNAISSNKFFENVGQISIDKKVALDIGFQVESYKIVTSAGGSRAVMAALIKDPEHRNDDDLRVLEIMIRNLPGFSRYSLGVRKQLGRICGYSRFGPGRTIIKQGHFAQNFYYILSGELEVLKIHQNEKKNSWVGTMTPGMIFGELALLMDNHKRLATLVTTKDTELLWLTRDDFEQVLKTETLRELQERERIIRGHKFFSMLRANSIHQLALTSQTVEVPADTLLLTEGDIPGNVYLLCEGEVKLLRCVHFTKVKTDQNKRLLYPHPLPPDIAAHIPMHQTEKVTELLSLSKMASGELLGAVQSLCSSGTPNQVATLGGYFDTMLASRSPFSLVTSSRLKYISISKHTFSKELVFFPEIVKNLALQHLELRNFFKDWVVVQKLYLERNDWINYKRKMMKGILKEIKKSSDKGLFF
ncbi:cyclic nucleotide-binding-like protein [Obelidium mucronatum]|nr:cyclic nucleotide-binding-like protein [Obelidium mucronatum]